MISEKNKKDKCQINMSKANLNDSIIGIFMKTYCSSGDPVFAQFHAFCTLYSSRPNKLPYSTNVILGNSPYSTEQFAVQRNEHILTRIVQNKLFLQTCGIDTKL
jgi:hypothetical protein